MSLADISTVPRTREELSTWSFSHATNHADIIRVIQLRQAQASQPVSSLSSFILDPFDPRDVDRMQTWFYQHFQLHAEMTPVLGISSNLSLDVDWSNPEALEVWINDNVQDHIQASRILNL